MSNHVACYFKLVTALAIVLRASCQCSDSSSTEFDATLCSELTDIFEKALLNRENIIRMKNAFFYSPTASPVLLKVEYNIRYDENITKTMPELPRCNIDTRFQNSTITLNDTTFVWGWTSSGVYTLFHPGVLNFMQLQLPYILLNAIQLVTQQTTDGPEADSFLWDGSYPLPTLRLNLHISYLTCIPHRALLDSVLEKLTTQVL